MVKDLSGAFATIWSCLIGQHFVGSKFEPITQSLSVRRRSTRQHVVAIQEVPSSITAGWTRDGGSGSAGVEALSG